MESSTKILRRLLDERGVEWEDASPVPSMKPWKTSFTSFTGEEVSIGAYDEPKWLMGTMVFHTPEQAIAATLGSCNCSDNCTNGERTETCKLDDFADVPFSVDYEIEGYDMDSGRDYATLAECSACGAYIIVPPEYHHVLTCDGDEVYQPYRFCPNCGRRIEQ